MKILTERPKFYFGSFLYICLSRTSTGWCLFNIVVTLCVLYRVEQHIWIRRAVCMCVCPCVHMCVRVLDWCNTLLRVKYLISEQAKRFVVCFIVHTCIVFELLLIGSAWVSVVSLRNVKHCLPSDFSHSIAKNAFNRLPLFPCVGLFVLECVGPQFWQWPPYYNLARFKNDQNMTPSWGTSYFPHESRLIYDASCSDKYSRVASWLVTLERYHNQYSAKTLRRAPFKGIPYK